eukprot:scaffold693_cov200-Alexandrium_tamarense.AAC.102
MNTKLILPVLLITSTSAFQSSVVSKRAVDSTSLSALNVNDEHTMHLVDNISSPDKKRVARRTFLNSIAAASLLTTSPITLIANAADSTNFSTFTDPDFNFHISIPSSWEQTTQKLSGRRKAIFFTDTDTASNENNAIDTLLFIAYTPIRDDFTSLASFGSVDQVAQSTILPKGELVGAEDDSKMLSATSKNNAYYFDYVSTPVVPVEAGSGSSALTKKLNPMHFRTIFTLLPLKDTAGLTLVTVTMQTTEEKYGGLKGLFDEIVGSYGKA